MTSPTLALSGVIGCILLFRCGACDAHIGVNYMSMINHLKYVHDFRRLVYEKLYGSIEYAFIYHR